MFPLFVYRLLYFKVKGVEKDVRGITRGEERLRVQGNATHHHERLIHVSLLKTHTHF
jgi:hypothetical protein